MRKNILLSVLVCGVGFLASSSYASEIFSKEFNAASVKRISIQNGSGNIQLAAHQKSLVTVEARIVSGTKDTCDVQIEEASHEILVKTKSKETSSLFSNNKCEVNLVVHSPRSMDIQINSGSGDVKISDLAGKLAVKNGNGKLSAKGTFSDASISLGNGDISLHGVNGPSQVNIGSGDAEIVYTSLSNSGDLRIHLGSGNLKVLLPKKASAQTRVRIGSGMIKNNLEGGGTGKLSIDGTIGSGDLILQNL